MAFCTNCGKPADPGPLCDDCAKAANAAPVPAPAATSAPTTAPAAEAGGKPAKEKGPAFVGPFLRNPVLALRDVWIGRRLRYAWLSILWIVVALFLTSFLVDIVTLAGAIGAGMTVEQILHALARGALAPVSTLLAVFLTVPVFAMAARKGPAGRASSYGRALAAYGAALVPYAVVLTIGIGVDVAQVFVQGDGLAGTLLSFYPTVFVEPARYGALVLALLACRAVSETTDDRRIARGGILALVVQAVVLAAAGYAVGLVLPSLF